MASNDPVTRDRWFQRRTVHPRAVWTGVGVALVGMVVTGAFMVSPKAELSWIGAVIIIVGATFAWWNGAMADIHGRRPAHHEIDEVREGSAYDGVLPADMEANHTVAAGTAGDHVREPGGPTTWIDRSRAAAATAVLAGLWLLVTVVTFNQDPSTHDAALRQMGAAVVLGLLALRLQIVAATSGTAALLAVIAAGFVISVLAWWPHHAWIGIAGLSGGIAALGGGLVIIWANRAIAKVAAISL